jgi:hypothetical protein
MSSEGGSDIGKMRTAWVYGRHISTLPTWTRSQKDLPTEETGPRVDADPRRAMVQRIVLALGCADCDRKSTDDCDFEVCVTELLAHQARGGD